MKVVTWNLGFWQHRSIHEKAWEYLREQIKPDLAFLQEVSRAEIKPDESIILKNIRSDWGTALFAKNMHLEQLLFENSYSNRVAIATLNTRANREVIAISVHAPIIGNRVFPHLGEIFDCIEKTVKNKTFILGGDLNTARLAERVWPNHGHGKFFERLSKSMFFDCFQKFHPTEEQTYFRNNSKWPFQDDHLFVSHDLADHVKSCYVLNNASSRKFSDHIPVVAEIDL